MGGEMDDFTRAMRGKYGPSSVSDRTALNYAELGYHETNLTIAGARSGSEIGDVATQFYAGLDFSPHSVTVNESWGSVDLDLKKSAGVKGRRLVTITPIPSNEYMVTVVGF